MTQTFRQRRGAAVLIFLSVLVIVMTLLGAGLGAVRLNPDQIIAILLNKIGIHTAVPYSTSQENILLVIRLPRVVLGLLVGAALASSGAAVQGLFRNPLADPSLIGISSGAALGVTLMMGLSRVVSGLDHPVIETVAAFGGAILTMLLIYRLATTAGLTNVVTMLLAGVAINALAGAGVGLLVFLAGGVAGVQDFAFWSRGSLTRANWDSVLVMLPVTLILLAALPFLARPLNILLLGEAEAGHLGVSVERIKQIIIVLVALAVGTGVAAAGVIGFVALVVPHLLRLTVGPDHRYVLPGSALAGAALLVGTDLLARTMMPPIEVPLGIITALIGGPFFLWLLLRDRNRGTLL